MKAAPPRNTRDLPVAALTKGTNKDRDREVAGIRETLQLIHIGSIKSDSFFAYSFALDHS
jgi:hypothetical protein